MSAHDTDPRVRIKAFLLKLLPTAVILVGVVVALPESVYAPLARINARATGLVLTALGFPAVVSDTTVLLSGYSIRIISECLALEAMMILTAFVLAYPASLSMKFKGLGVGLSVLAGANLLRFLSILVCCSRYPGLFHCLHAYFGQILILGVLVTVCLLWLGVLNGEIRLNSRLLFAARFVGIASGLFLVWLFIQDKYVFAEEMILRPVARGLLGQSMEFARHETYDYTLSIPTFSALVLASKGINRKRLFHGLPWGIALLCLLHFSFRVICVFSAGFRSFAAYKASVTLFALTAYLIPFLLWLLIKYYRRTEYKCPLCGVVRAGILEHIEAKHGETALKLQEVRELASIVKRCANNPGFVWD